MDNLNDSISQGLDKLKELANQIPGYKGYAEREARRESDAVQREFLAKRLTELKGKFQDSLEDCLADGNLEIMEPADRCCNIMDRLIERIRHASRGYAGLFDAVKVNEAELARIYEFDMALVSNLNLVEEAIKGMNGDASRSSLRGLRTALEDIDSKLNEREQILKGQG